MHRCQTCDKVMVCDYFIDNFFVVVSLLPMTSMIRWGLGKKDQSNRQNTENFLWNGLTGRGKKEKCPNPWEFAFQINLWVLCGFVHQCHNNRTRHFPGRIKYSHNVARWPVGLTVTLLRDRNGNSRQSLSFSHLFSWFQESSRSCRARGSWANEEFWHEMVDFGEMIQLLRAGVLQTFILHDVWVNCDPEIKPMAQVAKCILNFPFSLYNNSNNDLFIDNSKSFNNWPRSAQSISSFCLDIKPPGNTSLLHCYFLIIYTITTVCINICVSDVGILQKFRSGHCILYNITACKDLSNCGKKQEASKLRNKGIWLGEPALCGWLLLTNTTRSSGGGQSRWSNGSSCPWDR